MRRLLILMFGACLFCFQAAQAHGLDDGNARYTLEYNNQRAHGESRLGIRRDEDRYQLTFDVDHRLMSSSQKAVFDMEQCRVRPVSYVAIDKRPFRKEAVRTLEFDWRHKQATYNGEGRNKVLGLDEPLYDPISFFFEARCELMAGKTEFAYPVLREGSKRTHRYKVTGTEIVETGQGPVQALVVERQRSSTKRRTRLYVAPDLAYLLVKLVHQEGRFLNVVATLDDIDYRARND